MAHIAHQHQGAAFNADLAAIRTRIGFIARKAAGHHLACFLEALLQIAAHQSQPIAIGQHFILGIDTSDRVFAIHDRGDSAFHTDISQQGLIAAANRMGAIKDQFHMHAVITQQNGIRRFGIAREADEFRRIDQRLVINQQLAFFDIVAAHIGMAAPLNREGVIQKDPCARHNPCPAPAIIAPRCWQAAHGIGAVIGIIKAAPPCISRIQGKTRIGDWNDKLRACHCGDLGVDLAGFDLEGLTLGEEVADFAQEILIGIAVMRLAAMRDMPVINLLLQALALLKQGAVLASLVMQKRREPCPERARLNTSAWQSLRFDEICQFGCNLQPVAINPCSHVRPSRMHGQAALVCIVIRQKVSDRQQRGKKN